MQPTAKRPGNVGEEGARRCKSKKRTQHRTLAVTRRSRGDKSTTSLSSRLSRGWVNVQQWVTRHLTDVIQASRHSAATLLHHSSGKDTARPPRETRSWAKKERPGRHREGKRTTAYTPTKKMSWTLLPPKRRANQHMWQDKRYSSLDGTIATSESPPHETRARRTRGCEYTTCT